MLTQNYLQITHKQTLKHFIGETISLFMSLNKKHNKIQQKKLINKNEKKKLKKKMENIHTQHIVTPFST